MHFQVEHYIELVHCSSLPNASVYRRSILENEEIQSQIQYSINKGHIHPNSSPCGSRVIFDRKKDGTWRTCINYPDLNKFSVKNRYPLPRIDELIDSLKGAKFFKKIDFKSSYHQISIKSIDVWKTDFKTKEGLF